MPASLKGMGDCGRESRITERLASIRQLSAPLFEPTPAVKRDALRVKGATSRARQHLDRVHVEVITVRDDCPRSVVLGKRWRVWPACASQVELQAAITVAVVVPHQHDTLPTLRAGSGTVCRALAWACRPDGVEDKRRTGTGSCRTRRDIRRGWTIDGALAVGPGLRSEKDQTKSDDGQKRQYSKYGELDLVEERTGHFSRSKGLIGPRPREPLKHQNMPRPSSPERRVGFSTSVRRPSQRAADRRSDQTRETPHA